MIVVALGLMQPGVHVHVTKSLACYLCWYRWLDVYDLGLIECVVLTNHYDDVTS
jgi:hypothetical protein